MSQFKEAYEKFLTHHKSLRKGERLRRLIQGHGHAEMAFLKYVWWPLYQGFMYLHPEYEVADYKKGSRFLDFAFIHPLFRIAIEIHGFSPHERDVSRYEFTVESRRQTFLTGMGWIIIHFSYDDIIDQPELCQQLLQLVMGRYLGSLHNHPKQPLIHYDDREILRYYIHKARAVPPKEIAEQFQITPRTARTALQRLLHKGYLQACNPEHQRVRAYIIKEDIPLSSLL